MSSDRAETHFEPCGGCGAQTPSDRCIGCFHDFTPGAALRSGGEEKNGVDHIADAGKMVGAGVKPLGEWRRGYCDERVTIQQASFGGLYQVRVLDDVVWLDWPNRTAQEFATVALAKAAAQSDYERTILAALTNTDLSLRAENERLRGMVDGYGKLDAEYALAERRATTAEAKLEEAAKVLADVRDITDADNPESYRSDDREGCLDTVHSISKSFFANLKGAE